jgi:hypothetical protein
MRRLFILMLATSVLFTGCFRVTTELTSAGIENVMGDGTSLYDEDVTVQTRTATFEYLRGDWVGVDSSKRYLTGTRRFVSKPDTIPLNEIVLLKYDMGLVLIDHRGQEWDLDNGDWGVRYYDGRPAAIVSIEEDGAEIQRSDIAQATVVGPLGPLTYILWFFGPIIALGLLGAVAPTSMSLPAW